MKRYETICIVNPNLDADSLKEVVAKFSGLIQKLKGYLFEVNEWGKRKLAYEVKRFDKGYYLVLDFCGLPVVVRELERSLKLDDRILKYITVKIGEDVDPEDLVGKGQEKEDKREESHKESTKKDNGL
ncbi:MAG: 30S ribosomal protein S6 [Deltaproteobacteria bacterium]|nr:MAG: 30S ribosomal protein S6 [Deltaproteobacteria bacterium]